MIHGNYPVYNWWPIRIQTRVCSTYIHWPTRIDTALNEWIGALMFYNNPTRHVCHNMILADAPWIVQIYDAFIYNWLHFVCDTTVSSSPPVTQTFRFSNDWDNKNMLLRHKIVNHWLSQQHVALGWCNSLLRFSHFHHRLFLQNARQHKTTHLD